MEVGNLYKVAIIIVLTVMVVGIGILTVDKLRSTIQTMMVTSSTDPAVVANYSSNAVAALGNGSAALGEIPKTWLGLIITISVLAIIVGLVIGSFAGRATRR